MQYLPALGLFAALLAAGTNLFARVSPMGDSTQGATSSAPAKPLTPLAAPVIASPRAAGNERQTTRPLWTELTASQRQALAPLAQRWNSFPVDRKKKWLEVAPKYFALSEEGRQRMHDRMLAFVSLTPEQREITRENFKRAANMPLEQRQALVQQYRDLPQAERDALARKADAKPETQRRSEREAKSSAQKAVAN